MTLKCVWCAIIGSMLALAAQGCAHGRSLRLKPLCGSEADITGLYKQNALVNRYNATHDPYYLQLGLKVYQGCRERKE